MKRNLKIMRSKPEITDREIQELMNFERLLQDRRIAVQSKKKQLMKNSLIATGVVATGIIAFMLISKVPIVPSEQSTNTISTPQTTPSRKADSVVVSQSQRKPSPQIPLKTEKKVATEDLVHQAPEPTQEEMTEKKEAVYTQAEPLDGFPHLYEYFKKELRYPEASLKDSLEGVVTVIFSIDTNGRAQNLQIENSLGESFDQEVKRVITNMPQWKPATYNGTPVSSKVSVPLTFNIEKIEK